MCTLPFRAVAWPPNSRSESHPLTKKVMILGKTMQSTKQSTSLRRSLYRGAVTLRRANGNTLPCFIGLAEPIELPPDRDKPEREKQTVTKIANTHHRPERLAHRAKRSRGYAHIRDALIEDTPQ